MITVSRISLEDDLQSIVDDINGAVWDAANDVCSYDSAALANYLQTHGTVFVVAHEVLAASQTFLGMASARIEIKPYGNEHWLYVDEVDVCVDQRQKGAGKAIMEKLLATAEQAGCEEVWLGTEIDNQPANALYRSLDPDEVEQFVGYTYELDD